MRSRSLPPRSWWTGTPSALPLMSQSAWSIPSERAHVHSAASIEAAAIEHRPVVLDQRGILPDQVVRQFVHYRSNRLRPTFEHRFAPANDALVGFDLEEAPTRRNEIGDEFGDLHRDASECFQ